MDWLINDLDFGLFTFKEMTRSVSWLLEWPLTFANNLLVSGFSFSSDPSADGGAAASCPGSRSSR